MAERAMVVGGSGLVGGALMRTLESNGWDGVSTGLRNAGTSLLRLDVTDRTAVHDTVRRAHPSVVFLPAAWTDVDGCEADPKRAFAVNVDGTRHVAEAARDVAATLVLYSTDYVFDGTAGPYDEDAPISPISVYGRTKAEAEQVVRATCPEHLVLRTTWVYGWNRATRNFAMQVWQNLSAERPMRVPADQVANPTLADWLAEVSIRLLEAGARGTVNVVGRDRVDKAEFGRRLARTFLLDPSLIQATSTEELGQRAHRPLQAGLTVARLEGILGTEAMEMGEAVKRVRRQWRTDTHVAAGPAKVSSDAERLKQEILGKVAEYHRVAHARSAFTPIVSRVPYSGRVYGADELVNLVDASLDFWLTLGPWGDLFEQTLRRRVGVRDAALVNSGSSANLVAVTALTSPQLERPLAPGDEVITPAVTFPTTLAPLLQNRLVPVLVDCEIGTYNVDPALVEAAITDRTRAIMVPHTLGNPCDLDAISDIVRRHDLVLVEDCCDALGSTFDGVPVGRTGDVSTLSFYPAHHITMGEGGAVMVNRPLLGRIVRAVRDWGRDCWCAPGESNTCGKRFGWQLGDLPAGYDHKYTYSHIGYNLKPTDMQAAIGVAQLNRLDDFVAARRANFQRLHDGLSPYADRLILPTWHPRAEPAWFGFPITVGEGVTRRDLVQWLEDGNIETRLLFGGNILRQPAYRDAPVHVPLPLGNTDRVAEDTFFVGVYPGLEPAMVDFMVDRFERYFRNH